MEQSILSTSILHFFLYGYSNNPHFLSSGFLTTHYVIVTFFFSSAVSLVMGGANLFFFFDLNLKDVEIKTTYECGFIPFTNRRLNFNVNFYVVAILFIIFDLEVLFLFPWAVVLPFTGLFGFYTMVIFFIFLTVGLVFEFRSGILSLLSRVGPEVNLINFYGLLQPPKSLSNRK